MIVLIAVTEKQVPITDTFNPNPITGKMGIFNRVAVETETAYTVEIVGAYSTLELAGEARAAHAHAHPGRKYIQKVCKLDPAAAAKDPVVCVRCRQQTPGPESFCPRCISEQAREMRDRDVLGNYETADPVIQTDFAQHTTIKAVPVG
jgi:hypothetical protein